MGSTEQAASSPSSERLNPASYSSWSPRIRSFGFGGEGEGGLKQSVWCLKRFTVGFFYQQHTEMIAPCPIFLLDLAELRNCLLKPAQIYRMPTRNCLRTSSWATFCQHWSVVAVRRGPTPLDSRPQLGVNLLRRENK